MQAIANLLDRIFIRMINNRFLDKLIFRHVNTEKLTVFFRKLVNRETISYLFFGVLTTAVSVGTLYAAERGFSAVRWQGTLSYLFPNTVEDFAYWDANIISWVFAVLFAFVTNKLFVFESKSWKLRIVRKELGGFLVARLVSLGIDQGLILLLVSGMKLNLLLSKLIVQVIIVIVNYVLSKLFIFKKQKQDMN